MPKTMIDVKQIPFSTWWEIAQINGTWASVALKRWTATVDPMLLAAMKLDEWEEIAEVLGYSFEWACKQYKRYRAEGVSSNAG